MTKLKLFLLSIAISIISCKYVTDITGKFLRSLLFFKVKYQIFLFWYTTNDNAGGKNQLKMEMYEHSFDEKSLPIGFNMYVQGEEVNFYHRIYDPTNDLYQVNLGRVGSVDGKVKMNLILCKKSN